MTAANYGSAMDSSRTPGARGGVDDPHGGGGGAGACDDVIERLSAKSRRFQYLAAAIAGLANASDAVEVLCLSFILDQVDGITDTEKGACGGG